MDGEPPNGNARIFTADELRRVAMFFAEEIATLRLLALRRPDRVYSVEFDGDRLSLTVTLWVDGNDLVAELQVFARRGNNTDSLPSDAIAWLRAELRDQYKIVPEAPKVEPERELDDSQTLFTLRTPII